MQVFLFSINTNTTFLKKSVYLCSMGRPTKLTNKVLHILQDILKNDLSALVYTDEDLFFEINSLLLDNEQIGQSTFEGWIRTDKDKTFSSLIKKARQNQKRNLLKELKETSNSWQRFAWILERKFPEFNLKQLSETTHKIEPITINLNLNKNGKS